MPDRNTMRSIFSPILEMANNVHNTLSYFIYNFNRGYHGGELAHGIGKSLFTKSNDNELINGRGQTINIFISLDRSQELMKHKYNSSSPKYYYNEYMLSVLRYTGF